MSDNQAGTRAEAPPAGTTLVLGVGNLLLGDEGLGVHVARALLAARDRLPPGVDVIEAGTAILDVAGEIARHERLILLDAVHGGGAPGTVYRLDSTAVILDAPRSPALSLHQLEVPEALRALARMGILPERVSLIGAEPACLDPGTCLSSALEPVVERIVGVVREIAGVGGAGSLPPPA